MNSTLIIYFTSLKMTSYLRPYMDAMGRRSEKITTISWTKYFLMQHHLVFVDMKYFFVLHQLFFVDMKYFFVQHQHVFVETKLLFVQCQIKLFFVQHQIFVLDIAYNVMPCIMIYFYCHIATKIYRVSKNK